MDQGIEQNIGLLELDNNFPKLLGLSNFNKLGRALKDMLIGLINSLLNLATICTHLCLLNDKTVLHLLQPNDFLGSLALQLGLCFLQCLNLP